MSDPLHPVRPLESLGGGQLGRMLAMAAARLGFHVHIYRAAANPPAAEIAARTTTAGYDDIEALEAFARDVDVVTYEFENVPAEALDRIEALVAIRPNRRALAVSQDRVDEKTFPAGHRAECRPVCAGGDAGRGRLPPELAQAMAEVGVPAILKTRRLGYDGKGQARIDRRMTRPSA